jgi:hypothetical protein
MRFRWTLTVLTTAILLQQTHAAQTAPDIATVLERAARYVSNYEHELGNLLMSETYQQDSVWMDPGRRQQTRRTESDFLILEAGNERIGVRKVNRVDGQTVKSTEAEIEQMFDDSPEGVRKRIAGLRQESAAYNIGLIDRNINVPTLALKIARKAELPRFAFERRGADKINGVQTWELRFQEQRAPTIVHSADGQSLLSSGALWIEPETGRIMKTELRTENKLSRLTASARIVVTYDENKKLGFMVPVRMVEHYETSEYATVDTLATYSNFRSFDVQVKVEIPEPGLSKSR